MIFKIGKDIDCPKISDVFDYGAPASLHMRIINHLITQSILAFLGFIFRTKDIKVGAHVGWNMLINISFMFYRNRNCVASLLHIFQRRTLKITVTFMIVLGSFQT